MKKHKCLAFILALTLVLSMNLLTVQPVSATPDGFRIKLPFSTSWEDEPGQSYGKETSVDGIKDFSSPYLNDVDNQIEPPDPEIFGYPFGSRQLGLLEASILPIPIVTLTSST